MKSSKIPNGYFCLSPIYIENKNLKTMIDILVKNRLQYIQQNLAFEGMVCDSLVKSGLSYEVSSDYFISNYEIERN